MCMIQGFRKFVPGEVWSFDIDTESLDGSWKKFRPYLIIGANNRRIIVLKMTHGGENASNWIYQLDTGGDQKSRIILDCPITVDVAKVIDGAKKQGSFTHAMFLDIYRHHRAAMDAHALDEDCFLDVADIDKINDIRREHEDRLMCYSKYLVQYEDDEDVEEVDISADEPSISTVDGVNETVEEAIKEEKGTQLTTSETIIDITERHEKIEKSKRHYVKPGRRDFVNPTDVLIFAHGRTKDQACYTELERLGIKNAKFAMSDLMNRGKVTYTNNRYNVTLKSQIDPKKFGVDKYNSMILDDIDEFGITLTARIYDKSYNAIWKRWNDATKAKEA